MVLFLNFAILFQNGGGFKMYQNVSIYFLPIIQKMPDCVYARLFVMILRKGCIKVFSSFYREAICIPKPRGLKCALDTILFQMFIFRNENKCEGKEMVHVQIEGGDVAGAEARELE